MAPVVVVRRRTPSTGGEVGNKKSGKNKRQEKLRSGEIDESFYVFQTMKSATINIVERGDNHRRLTFFQPLQTSWNVGKTDFPAMISTSPNK